MASYYVYSGAVGAANGSSWADAYTTITAALSGKSVGDTFYVAHDHNESTAGAVTTGGPAGAQVLCVNRAGSVPPGAADLTTGAQIKTTGSYNISIDTDRSYWYGITFNPSTGASGSGNFRTGDSSASVIYEACHFRLGSTDGGRQIVIQQLCIWRNCTVQFGSDTDCLVVGTGFFKWSKTPNAIVGATIPTVLFKFMTGTAFLEGVDLSAITAGNIIMSRPFAVPYEWVFKDCKIAASVTISAASNFFGITTLSVVRVDSAGNYRHEHYGGLGTLTTETTIVRTGGASDGVTPISWKIVTAALATVSHPYESTPISVWNDTTGGTKTITVEGIWGGGAVPDNNDIWIEVEYLGDASSPQGSFVSSGVATVLTTPSSYASSSETWGGSTTKFKMSATTGTIQQKGPITVRVFAGLASSTFYVCPKLTVT